MLSRSPLSLPSVGLLLVCAATAFAQGGPKAPPSPATYDVEIHYRIDAARNERARQFLRLTKHLEGLGFKRDADDAQRGEDLNEVENVQARRLKGTIPSANVRKILVDPSVRTVLVSPAGARLPEKEQPVRVELELPDVGRGPQRPLFEELTAVLRNLGFQPAVGYDNRGYRRLVGGLPAGQLETLLADVRLSPASWGLLPKSLLSDMRRFPGGEEALDETLMEWFDTAEGKTLIAELVADWGVQPPAIEHLAQLPPTFDVKAPKNRQLVQKILFDHFLTFPPRSSFESRQQLGGRVAAEDLAAADRAAALLEKLLAGVHKSKAGPELMDVLLTNLENRAAAEALPPLFRNPRLLPVVEARPDLPVPAVRPVPAAVPLELRKLAPPVRALVPGAAQAGPRRFEVILSRYPPCDDKEWRLDLERAAPSLVVEGRVGQVVAVRARPAELPRLAALQAVSTVRLPARAESAVLSLPDEAGDPAKVLSESGLERLHKAGKRGQRVRVAVVDSDFRGWQGLVGKRLPASTRLLDLTTERNPTLQPDPLPAGEDLGSGVRLALGVLLAAPECDLTLVRVDPEAPHMMHLVLRRVGGDEFLGEGLVSRREELALARADFNRRREELRRQRDEMLRLFADDRPQTEPALKKRQELRDTYFRNQAQFDTDQRAYDALVARYLRYRDDLLGLRGVKVIVSGLGWHAGHPVDGSGPLARFLDDAPLCKALWFQPAGNTRGQAWAGPFRDDDGNAVMEFAGPRSPLPAGAWNHESNFLAWQPWRGAAARALPVRTRLRVTLQWSEAHDAALAGPGLDPYRDPLADLRLVVVNQPDPEGARRPSDDLAIVAQSVGLPQRIENRPEASTYEQVVEFDAAAAGRFAVRIEGLPPDGIVPPGTPMLPAVRRAGELRPRVFVETVAGDGRAVFEGYATRAGTIGTPADALRAVTVGAVDDASRPQPYSAEGAALGTEMSPRPDVRAADRLGLEGARDAGGTGMSAAFVAGHAAALVGSGAGPDRVRWELRRERPLIPPTTGEK